MTDIVERLRNILGSGCIDDDYAGEDILGEAADEIEKLRKALKDIADIKHEHINAPATIAEANLWGIIDGCVRVAEKALERKNGS